MNWILIVALAIAAYSAVVLAGWKLKLWSRLGITLYGPVMMIRTSRGRGFIDRVSARNGLWTMIGRASIYVTMLAMVAVTIFLAARVYSVLTEPITIVSPVSLDIRLPGSDSLLTLVYAFVGFALAMAAHELAHGIVSVAHKIKLESLGLLWLVIPIGAFVEPNEAELKKAGGGRRARIYSSGPAVNIIVAGLAFAILVGGLGPYAEPTTEGALVTHLVADSPADRFGIRLWSQISAVDGVPVSNQRELGNLTLPDPGTLLQVNYVYGSGKSLTIMPSGIVVTEVMDGPANNAGIKPGMIIARLNGSAIRSQAELVSVVENATHNAPVDITVLHYGYDSQKGKNWFVVDRHIQTINLTSKWTYYYIHYPDSNRESFREKSAIGVRASPLGVEVSDPRFLLDAVLRPYKGVDSLDEAASATVRYISLPFLGYTPVAPEASGLYTPGGNLYGVPHATYWTVANLLYWIFWANLLLGLTNALPALPMDGGYMLRDVIRELFHRMGVRLTGLDRTIGRREPTDLQADLLIYLASAFVYIGTAFLLIWQAVEF